MAAYDRSREGDDGLLSIHAFYRQRSELFPVSFNGDGRRARRRLPLSYGRWRDDDDVCPMKGVHWLQRAQIKCNWVETNEKINKGEERRGCVLRRALVRTHFLFLFIVSAVGFYPAARFVGHETITWW